MSDMGDVYTIPTDEEMLQMYAQMQGGLYGNNPAQRLNMFQDLVQSLGFDPVQLAGVSAQPVTPPVFYNAVGQVYGSNPVFGDIFNEIEKGADPMTVVQAVAAREGWSRDEIPTYMDIATQYATERANNNIKMADWERENAGVVGGWTMPDGSKAKNAPLGGNDINATAREYDLMGAPTVEELIDQYASGRNPYAQAQPVVAGPSARMAALEPRNDRGLVAANSIGGEVLDRVRGATKYVADSVISTVGKPWGSGTMVPTKPDGKFSNNPLVEQYAMQEAKGDTQRYVNKTKNQKVRSDANANAMRRIMALAAFLQGAYPD